MVSIFRHVLGAMPAMREKESSETNPAGAAPDLSEVPQSTDDDHERAVSDGERCQHRRIKEQVSGQGIDKATCAMTGADLKAFVATIPDDAVIYYIDVGERRWPVVKEVPAGIVIEGKK